MQDKLNREWDEAFVDKGWQQMQALLEKEMPAGWWQWPVWRRPVAVAASVLLLGVSAVLWQGKPEIQAFRIDMEGAWQEVDLAAERSFDPDGSKNTDHHLKNQPVEGKTGTSVKLSQPGQNALAALALSSSGSDTPGGSISGSSPHSFPAPASENGASGLPGKDYETGREGTGTLPGNETTLAEVKRETGIRSIDPLPGIAEKALRVQEPLFPVGEEENSSSFPWKPGIEVGGRSDGSSAFNGWLAGVNLEIPVRQSRWDIQTGVLYQWNEDNLQLDQSTWSALRWNGPDQEHADPNAPGGGNSFANSGSSSTRPEFSLQFNQVQLPLVLRYRLRPSLRLEGGVQLGYLAGAAKRKADPLPAQPAFGVAYDTNSWSTLAKASSGPLDNDLLNRLDWGLRGGMTYHPKENLGIRLSYQYGLTDLVKSSEYEVFNRSLNLSLIYILK